MRRISAGKSPSKLQNAIRERGAQDPAHHSTDVEVRTAEATTDGITIRGTEAGGHEVGVTREGGRKSPE